jgi:glucosamine-6-phosphate deaminase
MKVIVARDEAQVCSFAAHFVVRRIQLKPDLVLGCATGRTMVRLYRELVVRHRNGDCSFARVTTFNLDEYVRLPEDHAASYHSYMRAQLFDHVDIDPARTHLPDGNASDVVASAEAYEADIRAHGGIDLQFLGIGRNGHVAFNEPGSSLCSRTRVKRLTGDTIRANAPEFGGEDRVPRYVMTMGIGTIQEARFLLLLASGPSKAAAVAAMAEGPVSSRCPASVLQMHQHAFVVVDREAAASLREEYDTVEQVLADPYEEYFWEGH